MANNDMQPTCGEDIWLHHYKETSSTLTSLSDCASSTGTTDTEEQCPFHPLQLAPQSETGLVRTSNQLFDEMLLSDEVGASAIGVPSPCAERRRSKNEPEQHLEKGTAHIPLATTVGLANAQVTSNPDCAKETSIVIFDWDDTLLPTTFLQTNSILGSHAHPDVNLDAYRADLKTHAQLVRKVLTSTSKVAQVAIVTLAQRPWVQTSSSKFLPDLEIEALLAELNIPVYYAREHTSKHEKERMYFEDGMGDMDLFALAKRNAMSRLTKRSHRCSKSGVGRAFSNILSIGDGESERDAAKDLAWSRAQADWAPLCKTVKFLDDPSLKQLSNELRVLEPLLNGLVLYSDDIDAAFQELPFRSQHRRNLACLCFSSGGAEGCRLNAALDA